MTNYATRSSDHEFKVHCKDEKKYKIIKSWKNCRLDRVCHFHKAPREYDVIISDEYLKKAIELLKLKKVDKDNYIEK